MFDTPSCPYYLLKEEMTRFVNYKLNVYGMEVVQNVLLERAIGLILATNVHISLDDNSETNVFLRKRLKDKVLSSCKERIETDIDTYINGYQEVIKNGKES